MKQIQDSKLVLVTPPGALIDNAVLVTASIDTKGFDQVDIYVIVGATDIGLTTLKVQESDTDANYVDVAGLIYGTSGTSTLPGALADNTALAFHIDMLGRKRFLDVSAVGGDGTTGSYVTIFAVLSRAKESPSTAAKRGLAQELSV